MLLKPFFRKYDVDGDGSISSMELMALLHDIGEHATPEDAQRWMDRLDPDKSGAIEIEEFANAMLEFIRSKAKDRVEGSYGGVDLSTGQPMPAAEEDEEDEEDEMPEDLVELSPEAQQAMIKRRAAILCGFGTILVVVFSDPAVDVMSNIGERIGVPPFYIAFVLAPLASNASELIAALNYAGECALRAGYDNVPPPMPFPSDRPHRQEDEEDHQCIALCTGRRCLHE